MAYGIALNTSEGLIDVAALNTVRLINTYQVTSISGSQAYPAGVLRTDTPIVIGAAAPTPRIVMNTSTFSWTGIPAAGGYDAGTAETFMIYFFRNSAS